MFLNFFKKVFLKPYFVENTAILIILIMGANVNSLHYGVKKRRPYASALSKCSVGDFYDDLCSAVFTFAYDKLAAACHFEPLTDIVQGDMRLIVLNGIIARAVVLDDDLG